MRHSDEERAIRTGNPLRAILGADSGVVWAKAQVLADSPDKAGVEDGDEPGVSSVIDCSRQRQRKVRPPDRVAVLRAGKEGRSPAREASRPRRAVRVLTNSLLSTDVPAVHAGYRHYRLPLLEAGVELYEVKPLPGKPHPRGGLLKSPSSGQFSLHAKAFVFDPARSSSAPRTSIAVHCISIPRSD